MDKQRALAKRQVKGIATSARNLAAGLRKRMNAPAPAGVAATVVAASDAGLPADDSLGAEAQALGPDNTSEAMVAAGHQWAISSDRLSSAEPYQEDLNALGIRGIGLRRTPKVDSPASS